ncbi:RNA polymerase sigma factor [Fibrella aquatilis]|uniref:Sigma-70 family RNA polymerase sigma factor n=1 Tax=Fibrella aquatilis TaxID=2817059 RepID=A0A939GD59_9BACT|nr:sigma-70 family RNA polymerase sigma factor [Fibrella aquatilis]MBO0934397.1 sigma-70 family RNA polymerase sigma factor [Fibrella aquatilis]
MDLHAFKQRILPVQGRLFRLAQLFLRNREEAEDALQDVLLRLWSNRQQLDAYHSVEALAVQMTKNLCLDRLKALRRQPVTDSVEYVNVSATEASPHRQLEIADSASLMQRLIDALPEQQKLLIHLREVDECSYEEMEQLTGLTINNIRVILSRTRQRLRADYLNVNNHETDY